MFELDEKVFIDEGAGYGVHVVSLRHSSFHAHDGVLEIAVVLSGRVFAHVSFENFYLDPGDYVAINAGDPHFLQDASIPIADAVADPTSVGEVEDDTMEFGGAGGVSGASVAGGAEPVVAILHIDLRSYFDVSPHLKYVLFTLESFDLARDKHQENSISGMIADLMLGSHGRENALPLMELLVREYTSQNYYNRNANMTDEKQRKYFRFIEGMARQYAQRDVLSLIAEKEHYSKSYILHLFKDIGTTSFNDLLTYYRIAAAEKLLLSTDMKLDEIAAECGLSDVKYLIRDFRRWFNVTPGRYRKAMKDILARGANMTIHTASKHRKAISALKEIDGENKTLRFSINPISLKII
jgi:AraC-like DNA-binding protein